MISYGFIPLLCSMSRLFFVMLFKFLNSDYLFINVFRNLLQFSAYFIYSDRGFTKHFK